MSQKHTTWIEPFRLGESVYFYEFLPACFERTLRIEEWDLGEGTFEWVFTGERGGFTIRLDDSSVQVVQRFYDSFGLYEVEDFFDHDPSVPLKRWFGKVSILYHHTPSEGPEKKWFHATAPCPEPVERVAVVLDHKTGLTVSINGAEKIRQTCLTDVSRHQLRFAVHQGTVRGRLIKPQPSDATVRVDPAQPHQTMIGFGGIAAPLAYLELSPKGKRRWWKFVCEYNLLVQRENPIDLRLEPDLSNWDHLEEARPHYPEDFPNSFISNFTYNKIIQSLGGQVWFEFWRIPGWTRTKDGLDVDEYARAMLGYCQAAVQRTGAPPAVVGIQNERSQPAEQYHRMTLALRRELDRAGFSSVKIHMSNANMMTSDTVWGKMTSDGITRARAFTSNPQAWDAIDYSATNMYDYQEFFNRPDDCDPYLRTFRELTADKPFLSTELCVNNARNQCPTYRLALLMGQLYHKNLVLADAAALLYCFTLLNPVRLSVGWTRTLFVPDKTHGFVPRPSSNQLRVFGAYSRRIRQGMVRVEASTQTEDLLATAFVGEGGQRTVVLLNRSTLPRRVTIEGVEGGFTHMELVDPYHENEVTELGEAAGGPPAELVVEPGALVTLTTVPLGALPEGFTVEEQE